MSASFLQIMHSFANARLAFKTGPIFTKANFQKQLICFLQTVLGVTISSDMAESGLPSVANQTFKRTRLLLYPYTLPLNTNKPMNRYSSEKALNASTFLKKKQFFLTFLPMSEKLDI